MQGGRACAVCGRRTRGPGSQIEGLRGVPSGSVVGLHGGASVRTADGSGGLWRLVLGSGLVATLNKSHANIARHKDPHKGGVARSAKPTAPGSTFPNRSVAIPGTRLQWAGCPHVYYFSGKV